MIDVDVEQIGWQRRAVLLLTKLLELAAAEDLPPILWAVGRAGCTLHGQVVYAADPRRDFAAWRDALAPADTEPDEARIGDEVRLRAVWERLEGVQVVLTATIMEEDTNG